MGEVTLLLCKLDLMLEMCVCHMLAQYRNDRKNELILKPGDCLTLAKTWLRTQYVFGARLRRDRPLLVDDDTGLYTTL